MSNREETRAAISALLDAGKTPMDISIALSVARTTVYRVKAKREKGEDPTKT